jgi:hypothetical protein
MAPPCATSAAARQLLLLLLLPLPGRPGSRGASAGLPQKVLAWWTSAALQQGWPGCAPRSHAPHDGGVLLLRRALGSDPATQSSTPPSAGWLVFLLWGT